MSLALIVEVRFHQGRYHGAGSWPPAPARLFQALVAGRAPLDNADRQALTWLERQQAPIIAAPPARRQQPVGFYVPNNDLDAVAGIEQVAGDPAGMIRNAKGVWSVAAGGIRARKPLLTHTFDARTPLIYLWPEIQDCDEARRVCQITGGLYRLGRGVDPAYAKSEIVAADEAKARLERYPGVVRRPTMAGANGLAAPMPGSLASLDARHAAFVNRLSEIKRGSKTITTFANPPKPRFRQARYDAPPTRLAFNIHGPRGRFHAMPVREAARLTKAAIDRAADRLRTHVDIALVDRFLVGRGAGATDLASRVRVLPLPTLRAQVDRAIRRLAVEIPAACPLRTEDVAWAFTGLAPFGDRPDIRLTLAEPDAMHDRYTTPARLWRSETPVALPLRRRGQSGQDRVLSEDRVAGAVVQALRHAGVSARPLAIRVQREPFAAHGTRAEDFAMRPRFPPNRLWHVEVAFAEPVPGPQALGDGRYTGLGLLAPADAVPAGFAFAVTGGLRLRDPAAAATALRRALIARAENAMRDGPSADRNRLMAFVSGHGRNGAPLRSGRHAHVACVADLERDRLLIIAPNAFEHRRPDRAEREALAALDQTLLGFDTLRAGPVGRLALAPATFDAGDPLQRPSRVWRSVTAYRPSRQPKGDVAAQVAEAACTDATRLGLPAPNVTVDRLVRGPRGGCSALLRLVFLRPVRGPVLLGQNLHKGGGLFEPDG